MDEDINKAFEAAGRKAAEKDAKEDRTICTTCNPLQPSSHLLVAVFAAQKGHNIRSLSADVVPINSVAKAAWRARLAELSKGKECDHCGARIDLRLGPLARQRAEKCGDGLLHPLHSAEHPGHLRQRRGA